MAPLLRAAICAVVARGSKVTIPASRYFFGEPTGPGPVGGVLLVGAGDGSPAVPFVDCAVPDLFEGAFLPTRVARSPYSFASASSSWRIAVRLVPRFTS